MEEYPSLIWQTGLRENETRTAVVSEQVLIDLKLTGMVRADISAYPLIPCNRVEIEKRQRIFAKLLREPSCLEVLSSLKEALLDCKRIHTAYTVAEKDPERSLFFAVLAASLLRLCEKLAALSQLDEAGDGPFGELGAFYQVLLSREFFVSLRTDLEECLSRRGEDVRLNVNGSAIFAREIAQTAENSGDTRTMQARFEAWFRQMGIEDDLPVNRVRRRLDAPCLTAYAELYRAYAHRARDLHRQYEEPLFGSAYHMIDLLHYNEEISFLLDLCRYLQPYREKGYPMCFPKISERRQIEVDGLLDAALIQRELSAEEIVPNEVRMYEKSTGEGEKLNFYILSGANGGGKTTYLRSVGAAVLCFLLGLPITAARAEIYPFHAVYTHFPSNESFQNSGRFVDEANRADEILQNADADAVALFNETYSGTDEAKSEAYSSRLATEMYEKGVFGLYVTHIHALTNGAIPVLAAEIDPNDENRRTYKIRRVSKTKSSYAEDILKKYGLDRDSLAEKKRAFVKSGKSGKTEDHFNEQSFAEGACHHG